MVIAEGYSHSVALKDDGTVWTWGGNYCGQLGNGSYTDSNAPIQVGGLSGVTAIACGGYHSIALKCDGTMWAWGYNYGQLCDGRPHHSNVPVQVSGPVEILPPVTDYPTGLGVRRIFLD